MYRKINWVGLILALALLLSTFQAPVHAQDVKPPLSVDPTGRSLEKGPEGAQFDPAEQAWFTNATGGVKVAPQFISPPDQFGYSYNDAAALVWVDAKGFGAPVSFTHNGNSGAINLPFTFKFYENSYTSIYIEPQGYLSFSDDYPYQQGRLLTGAYPNNVIAPYWSIFNPATSGTNNRVYYALAGTAPNRYLVVEWLGMTDQWGNVNTFEVILYEYGNILFQYQNFVYANGSYWCGTSGIENTYGDDGLVINGFCNYPLSNKAVLISRPSPAARVAANPHRFGGTPGANRKFSYTFNLRNIGELGADVYDLTLSNDPAWPLTIYGPDDEALGDTNSNGQVDTGSIPQGENISLRAEVQAPIFVNVGDARQATIIFTSSLDHSRTTTVQVDVSIPPAFAQIYRDDANGAMSLDLMGGLASQTVSLTPENWWGYDPNMITLPNGNVVAAWTKYRCLNAVTCPIGVQEPEFTIRAADGGLLRPATRLADYSAVTANTYATLPALAYAPNGRIGFFWVQREYDSTNRYRSNLFFAVTDASGNLVVVPTKLTNNTTWYGTNQLNASYYYGLNLVATSDNRFTLAYLDNKNTSSGSISDVYTAVRDTNGVQVQGITKRSNDTAGSDKSTYEPTLTVLNGSQVFLTSYSYPEEDVFGMVLNSSGGVVKAAFAIAGDGQSNWDYDPDAVQLSNGRLLVGWSRGGRTAYVLLDPAQNFQVVAGPTVLNNLISISSADYVSVTGDALGRGILTWSDGDSNVKENLYYAVVDPNGGTLLSTSLLRSASWNFGYRFIDTSYQGYGNASRPASVSTGLDLYIRGNPVVSALPGGQVTVIYDLGNLGASADSSTLTIDLGSDLVLDNSSPAPSSSVGNVYTWNIPSLSNGGGGKLALKVSVPGGATVGTQYPFSANLTPTSLTDTVLANNSLNQVVLVSMPFFIPMVGR